MTPRIRMIVARFFSEDATGWHFIDIGELPDHTERRAVDAELILHPPYPRTVFVGTDYAGALFATRVEAGTDHIVVAGVGVSKWNRVTYQEPVAFIRNPDGPGLRAVSALDDKQLDDKTLSRQLRWTHALFDKLPAVREAVAVDRRVGWLVNEGTKG